MVRKIIFLICLFLTLNVGQLWSVDTCSCRDVQEQWCCRELSFVYNGCTIRYDFCIGVFGGLHHIKVGSIYLPPNCAGLNLSDVQYAAIAYALENVPIFPTQELDEYGNRCWDTLAPCPSLLCNIKIDENVCYSKFKRTDEFGNLIEIVATPCDTTVPRTCHSVLLFCIEKDGTITIKKEINRTGPPCPPECEDVCR